MSTPNAQNLHRMTVGVAVLAIAGAIGLALVVLWPRLPPTEEATPAPREEQAEPGVTITRPLIKHTENGRLAWQAQLRELHLSHGGEMLEAKGLEEAIIYSKAGAPLVRITADKISGNTGQRDFDVSGNVRVVSYRGAIITTAEASWNQKEEVIRCPGKVTLKSKQAIITATKLDYFAAEDLIKCPEQVRMYAGDNTVIGRKLVYNIETGNFALNEVQMVFHAEEAKEKLSEIRELQEE